MTIIEVFAQRAVFLPHDGYAKLPDRHRLSHRPTTQIQELVAVANGLHPREMVSADRHRHVAHTRQLAMYLTRKLTRRSFPEIGRVFGGRDHTTVIYAVKIVEQRMREDVFFKAEVAALEEALVG